MAQSTTTRKPAQPATVDSSTQPTAGEASMPTATDLYALIAQRRALDEQIKSAKAAMPKPSPLERVIAKQSHQFSKWMAPNLVSRVQERMRLGQPREDATHAVLAFFVAQVDALLDAPDTAESGPDSASDN